MHHVYNLMFPLLSEKAVEEAVRYCEQLKRREQEEDNVTIEELEKQRVEACGGGGEGGCECELVRGCSRQSCLAVGEECLKERE